MTHRLDHGHRSSLQTPIPQVLRAIRLPHSTASRPVDRLRQRLSCPPTPLNAQRCADWTSDGHRSSADSRRSRSRAHRAPNHPHRSGSDQSTAGTSRSRPTRLARLAAFLPGISIPTPLPSRNPKKFDPHRNAGSQPSCSRSPRIDSVQRIDR